MTELILCSSYIVNILKISKQNIFPSLCLLHVFMLKTKKKRKNKYTHTASRWIHSKNIYQIEKLLFNTPTYDFGLFYQKNKIKSVLK